MESDNEIRIAGYREQLKRCREGLRREYARFREIVATMQKKGMVRYNGETHCYEPINSYYHDSLRIGKVKLRTILQQFIQLQSNIRTQAMLVLELEHAIDYEERKGTNEGTKQQTANV